MEPSSSQSGKPDSSSGTFSQSNPIDLSPADDLDDSSLGDLGKIPPLPESHSESEHSVRVMFRYDPTSKRSFGSFPLSESQKTADLAESFLRIPWLQLEEVVGSGGMGVVYRAFDRRLNRRVAIKTIRADLSVSNDALRRFEREAELAARIQHPNVVQIYEVGSTGDRPYLIEEFLAGGGLEALLAKSALEYRQAAEWIESIARALQAAHNKQVIHRDLKPSNILFRVGAETRRLEPVITDFGLAKQTDVAQDQTVAGAIVGTPGYMSPEQATGMLDKLGPASDIYSLGATFYTMLTGRPPFRAANALETLELTRTKEPVPPSQLRAKLPADLETICLKCLAMDPARRYASAADVAAELDRYLKGVPILARPVSRTERIVKWSKRRPATASAIGIAVIAVISLLVGGLIHNRLLNKALTRAERNQSRALEAIEKFLTASGEQYLSDIPELQPLRERVLEEARALFRDLLSERDTQDPKIRKEAALAYRRVAEIEKSLNRFVDAEESFSTALRLLLSSKSSGEQSADLQIAFLYSDLGDLALARAQLAKAADYYLRSKQCLESLPASNSSDSTKLALANVLISYSSVQSETQNNTEGEANLQRAMGLLEMLRKDMADSEPVLSAIVRAQRQLSNKMSESLRTKEVPPLLKQSIEILEKLIALRPSNLEYRLELTKTQNNLANALINETRFVDADSELQRAILQAEKLLEDYPRIPACREQLARLWHTLGNSRLMQRRIKDAAQAYEKSIESRTQLIQRWPDKEEYLQGVAGTRINLAQAFSSLGDKQKADAQFRLARESLESLVRKNPAVVTYEINLAECILNHGNLLRGLGKQEESLIALGTAIDRLESVYAKDKTNRTTCATLLNLRGVRALTLGDQNQHAKSLADWDRIVELQNIAGTTDYRFNRALAYALAGMHGKSSRFADLLETEIKSAEPASSLDTWSRWLELAEIRQSNRAGLAADKQISAADLKALEREYNAKLLADLRLAAKRANGAERSQFLERIKAYDAVTDSPELREFLLQVKGKLQKS